MVSANKQESKANVAISLFKYHTKYAMLVKRLLEKCSKISPIESKVFFIEHVFGLHPFRCITRLPALLCQVVMLAMDTSYDVQTPLSMCLCLIQISVSHFHSSFIFQSDENTRPCNVGQASLLPFGLYFAVISWAGPVKGLPSESYLLAFLPVVILHFLFHPQTNDTSSLAAP